MEYLQHTAHIDWMSFVLRLKSPLDPTVTPKVFPTKLSRAISNEFGKEVASVLTPMPIPRQFGRAPYRWGWTDDVTKITILAGGDLDHFTIEIPGQACDALRRMNIEQTMLERGSNLLSRIDVAIDIQCALDPQEVVESRDAGRVKTFSMMQSSSGKTAYIGSMQSEHYTRVYRYAEPHPRSNLLRVEIVNRRDRAKKLGAHIAESGLASVLHPLWDETGLPIIIDLEKTGVDVKLSKERPERDGKNTVMWLAKQAAPAFKRMVREGHIIDAEKFLRDVFLNEELEF